ncbi:MAG: pyruvate:ferredoxin (flavodoxin) oxidoreductase, partial [Ruthenibacterium sp.]
SSVFAVYDELKKDAPKERFTLGINDDVTHLSLAEKPAPNTAAEGTKECKFWGLGGDGTVGANKNSTKIIGDHTDKYIQAYFQYDSKKTGGITVSHLRFGDKPIRAPYYINKADFVACHNPSYVIKGYKMVNDVKPGGVFMINCQWDLEKLNEHMPAEAKRYIANNNIQLYTINAIDKAIEIGLGKRTNTILQSAFFALAGVLPKEDALKFMKEAAYKSFAKKGDAIVEMNYKAIDAGFDAYVKIDVPADWKDAKDANDDVQLAGNAATVAQIKNIQFPVNTMNGDSLPVSAFENYVDGQWEQGASAYEKRGVAVSVPTWDAEKCIQCNQCSYVCPHATIRPFALSADEMKNAPASLKSVQMKGKGCEEFHFTLSISPLDCMGCGLCAGVCPAPGKALKMVAQEDELAQQEAFDYTVATVTKKDGMMSETTVKGSQFNQPLLEFSGSCAGCAETSYARLVTQLFGERMFISNATGCSSIWGGTAAISPYTFNRESGHGPAWSNSLFEDNAEHGFGMYLGQKTIRENLIAQLTTCAADEHADAATKEAIANYLATAEDGKANTPATDKLVAELSKHVNECETCKYIVANKQYLAKKSVWVFGGDGWAYDIGFGGLDHVLASGEDINVFVFDTEVYSNTGGQASKASQMGQVAQFAAAGKAIGKKSLSEIAMSYGYVYVAHVAMGANQAQTIKAIAEAEAYHGPSLIIGYAPCEMHGIKGGMANCQSEMKRAVDAGYWHLYRFDPRMKAEGKNPFTLDSKAPTADYKEFIESETRYSRLERSFPERAATLFEEASENAKDRYAHLTKLVELYK